MRVAFRVDASSRIGSGHFMRCMTLAAALEKHARDMVFISRDLPDHFQTQLQDCGYTFAALPPAEASDDSGERTPHARWLGTSQTQDARATAAALPNGSADWLVIDHYGLGAEYEIAMRSYVKSILVIDDLADRNHDCDALADQNPYENMQNRYQGKVPAGCRLFLGPGFSFLRKEFIEARKSLSRSGDITRVLIYFGGADAANHTGQAIEALLKCEHQGKQVDVVVGRLHPEKETIEAVCRRHGFSYHEQTSNMAGLMARADLAIGAGGTSTFERLYLRLPALITPIAENQIEPLQYMSTLGWFTLYDGKNDLENKLTEILQSCVVTPPDCVENGTGKIGAYMCEEFCSLKSFDAPAIRRTFHWLQNPRLRKDFMMSEAPVRKQHFRYWRNCLGDEAQRVYAIWHFGRHIGNCGLKHIDADSQSCELWIYIADESVRGSGIATVAVNDLLRKTREDLHCRRIYLHVAKENSPAITLYERTGFSVSSQALSGPWEGRDTELQRMEQKL